MPGGVELPRSGGEEEAVGLVLVALPALALHHVPLHVEQARAGDHICYYSDLRKMRAHYSSWDITQSLEETIRQIVEAWRQRRP